MTKIKMETGKMLTLPACPTVMVGSLVDGQADFATVAWTGVAASSPPTICISLQHHRHSLTGIRRNMVFSVNIPSTDLINETDYCGITSGSGTDKVKDCNYKVFYGKIAGAPLIKECAINHACEVVQILNLGSHELIVGRIAETFVNEDCLTEGYVDPIKVKPFFFAGFSYFALGKKVGEPFRSGKVINPKSGMNN
jgi:flavin reductase (DIM6/NTAB) family NADH-FMN oxidoreductase RutF